MGHSFGMADAVRFMWDYFAFPVWSGGELPVDLATTLQAWSDEGTERMESEARISSSEWMADWTARGRSLAHEVSRVLKRAVDYENEATGETERITPPEPPIVRRHAK